MEQLKSTVAICIIATVPLWRSGRDSNPRAAHHGNTISSRARYDLFDTTPYELFRCRMTA